jgi:propanediol dehydratase large subunit
MGRQRVAGDYLQPSGIFDRNFRVRSALNDVNDYAGPGTGYRLTGEDWDAIQRIPQAKPPHDFINAQVGDALRTLVEIGPAQVGTNPDEIVVAVGPAFGKGLIKTIGELPHDKVLESLLTGVAEEGLVARIVKVHHSADCAALGNVGAQLSGSGIAVGIQSRGTTVIQKKGLAPLNNLELFPQSPSLTLEIYQKIGRNAARYAKGLAPLPVAVKVDNTARLRLIVKTTLLHRRETEDVREQPPTEVIFDWEPDV